MMGNRICAVTVFCTVLLWQAARVWCMGQFSTPKLCHSATVHLQHNVFFPRSRECRMKRLQVWAKATNPGANGDGGSTSAKIEGLAESVAFVLPSAGDDVCFEGGCRNDAEATVELSHGEAVEELENPALREIKSSSAQPTVWSEFSALAAETGAINLGQGFPNWAPPGFVVAAAHDAISGDFHQYTRTAGHPRLVQLLAKRYTKHLGWNVNPFSEVAITIGASEALYVTFQVILSPGDEVVLLEPFFDLYLGQIRLAGGVPRPVPLRVEGREWRLDVDALRSAISPRTRAIVVNTPHNPTGKVFSKEELESIADVVRENPRLLVISDEVYKYMVYDESRSPGEGGGGTTVAAHATGPKEGDRTIATDVEERGERDPLPPSGHIHFSTLRGMRDRTINISSAGKTFSVTGWQVGWVLGPRRVIREIHNILPYMQFCAPTPLQEAVCNVLIEAERPYDGYPSYYDWLRDQYSGKRERLERALTAAGIESLQGQGGFFLIGDVSGVQVPEEYLKEGTPAMPVMTRDWAFCRWLAIEHGLVAIPTSPFFSAASRAKAASNDLVRFCFCKTDDTLEAAAEALLKMASKQPNDRAPNLAGGLGLSSG